jgi:hypothetical protein
MYKETKDPTLFDEIMSVEPGNSQETEKKDVKKVAEAASFKIETDDVAEYSHEKEAKRLKKIIWFYSDNSFEEFWPLKG